MGEMWSLSQWGYKAQLSAQIAGLESMPEIAKILQAQGLQMQPELAKDVAAMISRLVGRGGMQNMMWSVSLALIAMAMGGFLEVTGILHTLLAAMTKGVKRVGGLVSATVIASFAANLLTAGYLQITPGYGGRGHLEYGVYNRTGIDNTSVSGSASFIISVEEATRFSLNSNSSVTVRDGEATLVILALQPSREA